MERLNISFPEETRQQITALARLHGGNISEAVRVAVANEHRRRFNPTSQASDDLLERLDELAAHIRMALQAERERRAELQDGDE